MITRVLETKQLLRASVARLRVKARRPGRMVLATEATLAAPPRISSADSAMIKQAGLTSAGEGRPGGLQIDAITDHVFRIRYREGQDLFDHDTPMLMPAARRRVGARVARKGEVLTLSTRAAELSVHLATARIEARRSDRP